MANLSELNATLAWQQVLSRDSSADFVYAVSSTGVFCRPSCPSRRPSAANVRFFSDAAAAADAGYRACKRCSPAGAPRDQASVALLCHYLEQHRDRTVSLADLARVARSSPFTVQRTFTRVLGISPRAYQAQLKATRVREGLAARAATITDAIYEAGYGSASRFYEQVSGDLGMSPTRFRDGGVNESIRFATVPCVLGCLLVGTTERGVCSVMFGESPAALEMMLRAQFRAATIIADVDGLREVVAGILAAISGHPSGGDLPLDMRATAFQARVWQALRQIPRGETRSYAALAQSLGQPSAVRAVARACASNPVAVVVPCHRVVGSDGSLTGYRWGVERKKALLALEQGAAEV